MTSGVVIRRPSPWLLAALAGSLLVNVVGFGMLVQRRFLRPDVPPSPYRDVRMSLFASRPVPAGAIVMLGDSLTDWCEWRELLGRDDVFNRGINHETVAAALDDDRLEPLLAGQPATVVIMYGINDLLRGAPVGRVASDYRELVARIRERSPRTRIVVQSVLPIRRALAGTGPAPDTIRDLNARLEAMCREGACTYLSLFPLLAAADGELDARFTADGVHLGYDGYRVWRDALAAVLP